MFGPGYTRNDRAEARAPTARRPDAERVHAEAFRRRVYVRRVCNSFYFEDGAVRHGAAQALAYLACISDNTTTQQPTEPTTWLE